MLVLCRCRFRSIAAALTLICAAAEAAGAADTSGPLYNKAVLFPKNGNYYELYKPEFENLPPGARSGDMQKYSWETAYKRANNRTHMGVKGRLAVVNSRELNDFLGQTFRPFGIAWIGLRYWCQFNRLQWVTGKFLQPGDFTNWDDPWASGAVGRDPNDVSTLGCGGGTVYWPVHYWGVSEGFRWHANGQPKHGNSFFIEYPVGSR